MNHNSIAVRTEDPNATPRDASSGVAPVHTNTSIARGWPPRNSSSQTQNSNYAIPSTSLPSGSLSQLRSSDLGSIFPSINVVTLSNTHSLTRNPSTASPTPNTSVYRETGRVQGCSTLSQNPFIIESRPLITPPLPSSNNNPNLQQSNRNRGASDRNKRRRRSEVTTTDACTTEMRDALSTQTRHVILLREQLQEIGSNTKKIMMEIHSENKKLLQQISTTLKRSDRFGNSSNPTNIVVSGDVSLASQGHVSSEHVHNFIIFGC